MNIRVQSTEYRVQGKNSKIIQTKAKIISNERVAANFYKMKVNASQIAKRAFPGQFLNVRVSDAYQPLLRKPLGIHRVNLNGRGKIDQLEILYKVVGKGTEILSARNKGEYIDILGPLGNGFDCQSPLNNHKLPILVAGGIGVAPLLFLAERLMKRNTTEGSPERPRGVLSKVEGRSRGMQYLSVRQAGAIGNTTVLIGAKTKGQILCEKEFKDLGCDVKISTDDGSKGHKGPVTALLKKILRNTQYAIRNTIYACGPSSMLKETAKISKRYNIACFGLLEEYMACGTGACFGCVVATNTGYKRVCKEGPVFDLSAIRW